MPFLLQEENQNRDEAELGFGTATLVAVGPPPRSLSCGGGGRTDNKDLQATLFLLSFVFPLLCCVFYFKHTTTA